MSENTAINQFCNLPLFFHRKEFQFLNEARLQASVPLCVDGEQVALGRVCQVNQVQARVAKLGDMPYACFDLFSSQAAVIFGLCS